MTTATELHVRKDDLAAIAAASTEMTPADGQALFAVEHFALTANNMTYAAHGEDMGYWRFYPARDGFGIVPVWGFGRVVDSRAEGLEPDQRFYGYWPMASHALLTPARLGPRGFVDAAPHRQGLAAAYNSYTPAAGDVGEENLQALLRPMYMTSFLLELMLQESAAEMLVITSASSKTALGLAQLAGSKKHLIGLTSPASKAFVEATGYYAEVLVYDDAPSLAGRQVTAALIDFSGNGTVRRAVHEAFGDRLLESHIVGDTHWDAANTNRMPGVAAQPFFAPTVLAARIAEWGADGFETRLQAAWITFVASLDWLTIVEEQGAEAVIGHWQDFAAGRVDPAKGIILSV